MGNKRCFVYIEAWKSSDSNGFIILNKHFLSQTVSWSKVIQLHKIVWSTVEVTKEGAACETSSIE